MLLTSYLDCFNHRTDQDIQTYTIAVINALFLKAPEEKRQVRLRSTHTQIHCIYCIVDHFMLQSSAFFNSNSV